jgi:hypothetical protein
MDTGSREENASNQDHGAPLLISPKAADPMLLDKTG